MTSHGLVLPDNAEAGELLDRLGVEPIDRAATLESRPDPLDHAGLWSTLDRICQDVRHTMGVPPSGGGWPALPPETGHVGRHLHAWVCLAVLPDVRRYHAHRGVPDDVSWASLAALGAELSTSRQVTGDTGVSATWDLPRVFRGVTYRLGRLAFERQPPLPESSSHPVLVAGASGLNTHVPSGGPLDPAASDASFARARSFFPDHFAETVAAFCCHSWLMDDQLAAYLPPESNILRFQGRFQVFADRERADWAPLENLFHRRFEGADVPPALLDELPQRTTLQRGIVTHLRSGGHWYNRTGWLVP